MKFTQAENNTNMPHVKQLNWKLLKCKSKAVKFL